MLVGADVSAAFRSAGEHLAIDLAGGHALFTTRRGGVSAPPYASLNLADHVGDDPAVVVANRARLAQRVGVELALGRPTHGTEVRRLDAAIAADRPVDGLIADRDGVGVVALGADCLPIALIASGAVAMLHCGWRGLAGRIAAAGVDALRAAGADGPIAAAIGPGAGACCYEVGEEVHAAFVGHGPDVRHGRRLDLKLVARRELRRAGVRECHDVGLCTICDPERFFSHRRDGAATGRQGGVAWRS